MAAIAKDISVANWGKKANVAHDKVLAVGIDWYADPE